MTRLRNCSLGAAVLLAMASSVHAEAPADGGDILYSDPSAQSSAAVTQLLPNSSTSQMLLTNVRSIRVHEGILIIQWGTTATTLFPRQYVSVLTVNKRATPPTSSPIPPSAAATQPDAGAAHP